MRGPSFSDVCPSARFTFDLLGGVGGCDCGSSRLSEALLFLCGLWLLLSGLFVLRWGAEGGVGVVLGGGRAMAIGRYDVGQGMRLLSGGPLSLSLLVSTSREQGSSVE